MKTFKEYLIINGACAPAIEWAKERTVEQAVADCHRGDWLLWLGQKSGVDKRPLTLAKGKCAETVIHLMKDERSINAVKAAISYGNGLINEEELKEAAYAAAYAVVYDAYDATDAAFAAYDAAYTAFTATATAAADAYVVAAYASAADYAAIKENQLQTAEICRDIIGAMIIEQVNKHLNSKT